MNGGEISADEPRKRNIGFISKAVLLGNEIPIKSKHYAFHRRRRSEILRDILLRRSLGIAEGYCPNDRFIMRWSQVGSRHPDC
jgi:hypothetical protein